MTTTTTHTQLALELWETGHIYEDTAGDEIGVSDRTGTANAATIRRLLVDFESLVCHALQEILPDGTRILSNAGSMSSAYLDVVAPGKESVEVRVSNHRPRGHMHCHSFETTDTAPMHLHGLNAVAEAVADAADDDLAVTT